MKIIQLTTIYDHTDLVLVQHALTDDGRIFERHERVADSEWTDWFDMTGNIYERPEHGTQETIFSNPV